MPRNRLMYRTSDLNGILCNLIGSWFTGFAGKVERGEYSMPVYKADDMLATPDVKNPDMMMIQFGGELMKVGIVTYKAGEGPPPHYHPNDEQYIYALEGRAAFLLDNEIFTVGTGDLVHIPRNTVHGLRILDGPFRFFTCKSPSGSGKLSEDYTDVPNVAELQHLLAEAS